MIAVYQLDATGGPIATMCVDDVSYVANVLAAEFGSVPRELRGRVKAVPEQASMAQAVAILSYAKSVNRFRPLWPTQRDQCYMPAERPATAETRAIAEQMRGIYGVKRYGDVGEPARMRYAKACGGHTDADGHVGKAVGCPCGVERQGHGWGGCQCGMMVLAELGWGWQDIVEFYWDVDVVMEAGEAFQ